MSSLSDYRAWRGRTARGIRYRLIDRSGEHEYNASTITEVYLIRARDLMRFIWESFPPPDIVGGVPIDSRRLLPGSPAYANMGTRRIRWKRFIEGKPVDPLRADQASYTATYGQYLEVTIEYSNENRKNKDPQQPHTYLEISATGGGQFLSTPTSAVGKYAPAIATDTLFDTIAVHRDNAKTSGTDPNGRVDRLIPETEWVVRWNSVSAAFFRDTLLPKMRAALGKVNSATTALFYDAPPETILFIGWSFSQEYSSHSLLGDADVNDEPDDVEEEIEEGDDDGEDIEDVEPTITLEDLQQQIVDVELKFLEKNLLVEIPDDAGVNRWVQVGHNHVWREETGRWEYYYPDGTHTMFSFAELDSLFNVELIDQTTLGAINP